MKTTEINKVLGTLENKGFSGTDASIHESVLEYGFIYNENTETAIFGNYWIYDHENMSFGITKISKSDILEAFQEQKEGILSFCGKSESEFFSSSLQNQIDDIEAYSTTFMVGLSMPWSWKDLKDYADNLLN